MSKKSSNSMPSSEELNRELRYDPLTGELYWKIPKKKRIMNRRAGCIKGRYRYLSINRINYLEHRIIWTMIHGSIPPGKEIDHIDRDRYNNKLGNLRLVTRRENILNSGVAGSDCSKYPGVTTSKTPGKYTAGLCINSNRVHLGTYVTEEEAYNAYCQAVIEYNKLKLVNAGKVRELLDIGGVKYKVTHELDGNRSRYKWVYKVIHYRGNIMSNVSSSRYGYKSVEEAKLAGSEWLMARELQHIINKKKLKKTLDKSFT